MYRTEQGFLSRTCLPDGLTALTAERAPRFPFSRVKRPCFSYGKPVPSHKSAVFVVNPFFIIPNRAKILIQIGLLALFFYPSVCKNIFRRIFL